MRKKREELKDGVVSTARRFAKALSNDSGRLPRRELLALAKAIADLDNYDVASLTGEGALANRCSPETAHQSAALAALAQGSIRQQIVTALINVPPLANPGYTDEQLERRLSGRHQTVSSARNWLVNAGWVQDSGARRKGTSRRWAVVWELTPAAMRHIKEGSWKIDTAV